MKTATPREPWRQHSVREEILDLVEQAREDGILEGVNFNSPKQTVVAGDKAAVARFAELAKENRIKAIPLSVSTAFHSPMMIPAAEAEGRIASGRTENAGNHRICRCDC